jgi:glutamate-1-semialdehyde 2,1-aminomutase
MQGNYSLKTPNSRRFYERARRVLPAGVSYSIRYFRPYPFYTARAKGSKLYDIDGNEYIDFWLGHTALILGHSPPAVVEAVKQQLENGTLYGTSHEIEIELAEQIVKMVPSAKMVRFTNSGTEANLYAVRLARAYTSKSKIAKFQGGWHGGYDALQIGVKYPFDLAESAGLTTGALQDTIVLPFNDLEGVRERLKNDKVASITVEPVLGAGGVIPAEREFLEGLRELCDEMAILLIFDEVITGFRLAPGGGQQYYGVTPDITVLGKILGGGFPIGAFCGSREIMSRLDTLLYERPLYSFHGGTFAANPVSMTAGLTTLKILEDGSLISNLNRLGEKTREELREIFQTNGMHIQATGVGSLFGTHFTKDEVKSAHVASKGDRRKLVDYHSYLIANGVFLLPAHEGVLSTAHSKADMEKLFSLTEEFAKQSKTI